MREVDTCLQAHARICGTPMPVVLSYGHTAGRASDTEDVVSRWKFDGLGVVGMDGNFLNHLAREGIYLQGAVGVTVDGHLNTSGNYAHRRSLSVGDLSGHFGGSILSHGRHRAAHQYATDNQESGENFHIRRSSVSFKSMPGEIYPPRFTNKVTKILCTVQVYYETLTINSSVGRLGT